MLSPKWAICYHSLHPKARITVGEGQEDHGTMVDDLGNKCCLPDTAGSCTVNSLQLSQHEQDYHAQDRQNYSVVWGREVSEQEGSPPPEMLLTFGSC